MTKDKILSKIELELKSSNFTLADSTQLRILFEEQRIPSYLGMMELAEKYLPVNIEMSEIEANEILEMHRVWNNLVNRKVNDYTIRNYEKLAMSIRLKEVIFSKCWFLSFYYNLMKRIDKSKYLEFNGWEEVFLSVPLVDLSIVEIPRKYNFPANGHMDIIKAFYLLHKLQVRAISKQYNGDLANVAIEARKMNWLSITKEDVVKEKQKILESNLFGKDIYLTILENEFKI